MMICAPRWIRNTPSSAMDMNGACYLRTKREDKFLTPFNDNNKQVFNINNSRTDYSDYHLNDEMTAIKYYGLAQGGMSLKVTNDSIIIGAPGLLVWSGGVLQYSYQPDENSIRFFKKPTYNPFFTPDVHPDEYFGYSVESGVFQDGGTTLYVAGGPKAKRGFGMVLVFVPPTHEEAPLNIRAKLEGPQLGAYFGASLSCLDINADGRTDILVGAPNYVKQFPKDDAYDQGAVFVYLNKEQATGFILDYAGRVTGSEANGAKFGYSIADLGDIDSDGYNDVAVSAPWENDGAGAVYIYKGDEYGLNHQYVQRIVASEARGFGMALTRGHDVDHNMYNDLVIGAYETGAAYIYRSIPTVKVQATIIIPGALNLPQNTTNFTAQFCVNVQALRVNRVEAVMDFKATVSVDPVGKRTTLAGKSMHTYKVSARSTFDSCVDKIIEIKPGADLSRPILLKFDLEPIDRMQDNPTTFLTTAGRVSDDSILHVTLNNQLVKECGKDLICKPWLETTLEAMNDPYVPGTDERLGAIVTVLNKEEPAFGIRVNLTLPSLPKRVPTTCNLQGLNLTCNLRSPFNQNETTTWEIEFEYIEDMREVGMTIVEAAIDDPVPNRVVSDNSTQYLEISIVPVANISASGKALPNSSVTVSREKNKGGGQISFEHYFQVSNAGPSDWPDLTATIIVSGKGSLMLKKIAGCAESRDSANLTLACSWPVKAKHSLAVVLYLRYDFATNGKSLEEDTTCNITSTLFLDQQNIELSLSTTIVLDPAPAVWIPLIVAVIVGLLLLALITFSFYKYGFFSRALSQAPKYLNHTTLREESNCSSSHLSLDAAVADESKEDLTKPSCSSNFQVPRSTASDCSDEYSGLDNTLPLLNFQGPHESDQNGELLF